MWALLGLIFVMAMNLIGWFSPVWLGIGLWYHSWALAALCPGSVVAACICASLAYYCNRLAERG